MLKSAMARLHMCLSRYHPRGRESQLGKEATWLRHHLEAEVVRYVRRELGGGEGNDHNQ